MPPPELLTSIVEMLAPEELAPEDVPAGALVVDWPQMHAPSVPSSWQTCVLSRPLGQEQSCV